MGKFRIETEEISKIIVEVEAETKEEAQHLIVEELYNNADFHHSEKILSIQPSVISWEIKKVEEL